MRLASDDESYSVFVPLLVDNLLETDKVSAENKRTCLSNLTLQNIISYFREKINSSKHNLEICLWTQNRFCSSNLIKLDPSNNLPPTYSESSSWQFRLYHPGSEVSRMETQMCWRLLYWSEPRGPGYPRPGVLPDPEEEPLAGSS